MEQELQLLPNSKRPARILLEGRYRKFVRDLPQTIFYCPSCKGRKGGCERCDGYGKLTKDSVQEILARKILPMYKARRGKFHGAGREDVDVRMLGGGRPFVFEILKPRNLEVDEEALLDAIHDYGAGRIQVTKLVPVPRRRVAELKETHSDKIYRVLVSLEKGSLEKGSLEKGSLEKGSLEKGSLERGSQENGVMENGVPENGVPENRVPEAEALEEGLSAETVSEEMRADGREPSQGDLLEGEVWERARALVGQHWEVLQRTPHRVAHRRADKERRRRVEILDVGRCDEYLEVEIRCQHGTYVKEWISGDRGRSSPSLGELLACPTTCLALDVLDILGPFPELDRGEAPSFEDELSWPLPTDLSADPWILDSISEISRRAPEQG